MFCVARQRSLAPLVSGSGEGGATETALTGELVGVAEFDVGFEEEGGGVDGTLNGDFVETGIHALGPVLDGDSALGNGPSSIKAARLFFMSLSFIISNKLCLNVWYIG